MKVIFLNIFLCFNTYAGEGSLQSSLNGDPFARTDYDKAFSPQILKKFVHVLAQDGSLSNMPEDLDLSEEDLANQRPVTLANDEANEEYNKQRIRMIEDIKLQLTKAKRDAVLRPLYEAGLTLTFQGASIGLLLTLMPMNSFGGGLGMYAFLSTIGWIAKDAGKTLYTYLAPGNDPLHRWENKFAETMSYIPYRLWPQIIDMFGAVRIGRYSYHRATEFFNIIFNLPMIHCYPYRPPLALIDLKNKSQRINSFITKFFRDYENAEEAQLNIQSACKTYLRKLAKSENGFVCVHLVGPGGIGKTHFSRELKKQLSFALEESIPVEEITIRSTSNSELEGDQHSPGSVLLALSRIGKQGKPYGMLIFDEAAWLNSELKETAKKMFEPSLGSFTSQYLDGLEVSFKGFLLVFISNTSIEDPALNSRFINVKFPSLQKESLKSMALASLPQYLDGTNLKAEEIESDPEILDALEKATTMRDIEKMFPFAVEKLWVNKLK